MSYTTTTTLDPPTTLHTIRLESMKPPTDDLDPISESRALQTLQILLTTQLNKHLHHRWKQELKTRTNPHTTPILFLEPIPALKKPNPAQNATLRAKIHLLRARIEKGKELAAEIERRMADPDIVFPAHFCYTCVVGGEQNEILLTRCGHRVCRTCLEVFGDGGRYECAICFCETGFVARSGLSGKRARSEQICSVRSEMRRVRFRDLGEDEDGDWGYC